MLYFCKADLKTKRILSVLCFHLGAAETALLKNNLDQNCNYQLIWRQF